MEQKMEMVKVKWESDETFAFRGVPLTNKDKKMKAAWRGFFINRAPNGLKPGAEYCLKEIMVLREEKRQPQKRDYYDVVAFQGAHQRRILARNIAAVEVETELREGRLETGGRICYIVEPVYEKATQWFEKCWRYPAALRLDLIGQYAQGCLELRDPKNCLQNGRGIDAHRDIKRDNGMVEMVDGKPHIRLIDYASVHLEQEVDNWETGVSKNPDGTHGGFLSRSNTAPEDLRYTDMKVGATTDVYALGMMLASMFVHINGEYFNFNYKWCGAIPDDSTGADAKDQKVSQEFVRCWEKYDRTENATAWIEQALWERSVGFRWEELPDLDVMKRIHRLFVRSTRIDPNERISLENFVSEIRKIRDMAAGSKKKIPVSLYLFEQTDFDLYGKVYAQRAAEIFRKEGKNTKALCVRYHHLISSQSKPKDSMECQQLPGRSEQDLFDFTAQINRSNGKGADITAMALYLGGKQLDELRWAYEFTGHVYLFCREIPRGHQMLEGLGRLQYACGRINETWNTITYIDAHVIRKQENSMEEEAWCTQTLIPYTGPTGTDPGTDPMPGPEKPGPNMRPYGELYVTLPNGRIFPI